MLEQALRLFPALLYIRIQPFFWIYWGCWLLTLGAISVVFRWARPRLRERVLKADWHFRSHAHRVRFRSHEHEDAAARRERHALTWFFRFWTNFASAPCLATLSLLIPFFVYWKQYEQGGAHLMSIEAVSGLWMMPGVCYSGSMLLSFVLKRVFRRLRPPLKQGDFGHKLVKDPSFPSGHSLTSFCFWTMVPISASMTHSSNVTVLALCIVAATTIALTGLSRVYLRVHFPSDVVGGFLIGAIWCGVCLLLVPGPLAR